MKQWMVLGAASFALSLMLGCAAPNPRGSGATGYGAQSASPDGASEFTDRTLYRFGTKGCETTRRSVMQRGNRVSIVLDRPKSSGCTFTTLVLAVGEDRYSLDRLYGFTKSNAGRYTWSQYAAEVEFIVARKIEASDLRGEFGLIEVGCRDGICVTDSQVAKFENERVALARAKAELERDLAEAKTAELPADLLRLRDRLYGKNDAAVAMLDARMVAFVAAEALSIGALDAAGLRTFLKARSVTASTKELAATEAGLALATSRLKGLLVAQVATGTDDQREALLTDEYADQDTRDKSLARLRADYAQRREFAPLYRLYKLTDDVALMKLAQPFARTTEDRRRLEEAAVMAVKNPGRLFDVNGEFSSTPVTSSVKENMGIFANFTVYVYKQTRGTIALKLRPDSPLRLRHGRYAVTVDVDLSMKRDEELRSGILGNKNTTPNIFKSDTATVTVSGPDYEGTARFDFGNLDVGYFQSGSRGGYTAIRLSENPQATLRIRSIRAMSQE